MKNNNPLISVIIPAYNSAKTISESIDSVLKQAYDNTEILVIDDGSTDNTEEVIASYGNRIIYVKQANSGPSAARNRGINESFGDLIAFLDADDVWVPNKLSKQVQRFIDNPDLGLCGAACNNCNSDLDVIELHDVCPTDPQRIWRELLVQNLFATPTVVVRRECFQKAGYFNESIGFAEDWDMWLRIVNLYSAAYIDEPLCLCRRLDGGLTNTFSHKKMEDWQQIIELNRKRFGGIYVKTLGYFKALSWYYFNCAYYYEQINDLDSTTKYLYKSLMLWPFNMPKRYKGLLNLLTGNNNRQSS